MNKVQIEQLQALDPDKQDGTIQGLLLRDDINQIPFGKALEYLVVMLTENKKALVHENKAMSAALKKHGLYTAENIGIEV